MDSLRSATTMTVPARSGNRMASCASARTTSANTIARKNFNPRFGSGQTNQVAASGTNSRSQTDWKKVSMTISFSFRGADQVQMSNQRCQGEQAKYPNCG